MRRDGGKGSGELLVRASGAAMLGMTQQAILRFVQQFRFRPVVGNRKMRHDAGLKRKAPEERLAKGVDSENFHPPRRFQYMGKQQAGAGQLIRRRLALQQLIKRRLQIILFICCPPTKLMGDANRHFRRRRASEGQAKNAPGIGAAQQYAQHPVN